MPSKTRHFKNRRTAESHALHGVWMALVVLALLVSSAPAAQWVVFLTQAVKTSHQVQLVHNGCDVFVVMKHPAANVSAQVQARSWTGSHQHTAGDNLLGFFGKTLDTQQDHVIQLPCEGSSIGEVEASRDAFQLDPDKVLWQGFQIQPLLVDQSKISPKPISSPGSFSTTSRLDSNPLSCIDKIVSHEATVLLI